MQWTISINLFFDSYSQFSFRYHRFFFLIISYFFIHILLPSTLTGTFSLAQVYLFPTLWVNKCNDTPSSSASAVNPYEVSWCIFVSSIIVFEISLSLTPPLKPVGRPYQGLMPQTTRAQNFRSPKPLPHIMVVIPWRG